ncbi:hypothetical protein NFI96_002633 [Prochilodus magdalenae]|nr:hypothetical protein NFI96_002633 [Prochilodus magdalenae]
MSGLKEPSRSQQTESMLFYSLGRNDVMQSEEEKMSSIYTEGPDPAIYYSELDTESCGSHAPSPCGSHMHASVASCSAFRTGLTCTCKRRHEHAPQPRSYSTSSDQKHVLTPSKAAPNVELSLYLLLIMALWLRINGAAGSALGSDVEELSADTWKTLFVISTVRHGMSCDHSYTIRKVCCAFTDSSSQDCSGVVPDCHGVAQNGSGSSSVTSPALVLVEMPNESVCGGTVGSTKMNGVGADPSRPPCRKAKDLRKERRLQKEQQRRQDGGTLTSPDPAPSNPASNQPKSLEEFIADLLPDDPSHRLEVRLVRSAPPSPQFKASFDASYQVYKLYQTAIHHDPPEKPSESQVRLVPVSFEDPDFLASYEQSAALYARYQMSIHGDSPFECDKSQELERSRKQSCWTSSGAWEVSPQAWKLTQLCQGVSLGSSRCLWPLDKHSPERNRRGSVVQGQCGERPEECSIRSYQDSTDNSWDWKFLDVATSVSRHSHIKELVRTPTGPPQSRYDVGGGSFSALQ